MGYLANFIIYTLAMVGVIVVALMVFKTSTGAGISKKSKTLKVHDTLSLGPRKTLYIVSAGAEKFLIAGDVDKTCLISKLEDDKLNSNDSELENIVQKSFKETIKELPEQNKYIDRKGLGICSTNTKPYNSVMKNLAERIKQ